MMVKDKRGMGACEPNHLLSIIIVGEMSRTVAKTLLTGTR